MKIEEMIGSSASVWVYTAWCSEQAFRFLCIGFTFSRWVMLGLRRASATINEYE